MSFFERIQKSTDSTFYGMYIRPTDNQHEQGRLYYISKNQDKSIYSGDNRGIGQGGYISNIIDTHFVECSKDLYEAQNAIDSFKAIHIKETKRVLHATYLDLVVDPFSTIGVTSNGKSIGFFSFKYAPSALNFKDLINYGALATVEEMYEFYNKNKSI